MNDLINEEILVTKTQYDYFKSSGKSFSDLAIPIYQLISEINCKAINALNTNDVSFDLIIGEIEYNLYGKSVLDYTGFKYSLNKTKNYELIIEIKLED